MSGELAETSRRQFKSLFCQRFGCPVSEYQERAFKQCLYGHARLLAPLIRLFQAGYFAWDLKFIDCLGATTDVRGVYDAASYFQDKGPNERGVWRRSLRIRVSGRKVIKLARSLFSEADLMAPRE